MRIALLIALTAACGGSIDPAIDADNQKNGITYELPLTYDGPRWFRDVRADPVAKLLNLIIIVFQAGMELQCRGFAFN